MSFEWRPIQLRELGRIVTGKTPSTVQNDFFGGSIPFLTPTDMVDGQRTVNAARTLTEAGLSTVKNCLVPRGVAVSCIGWQMGKSVLVLEPTVTNQQINTVVVDESIFDLSFVYYLLSSMREQIFELGATPTRTPIVNKSTFCRIPVLVPGLEEQKRIADVCSSLDDRITLLRATNATLEAIAQALFKSWFVDFDPVHANACRSRASGNPETMTNQAALDSRFRGNDGMGLNETAAALFPDSFEESELGLPRGWRVETVGDNTSYLNRGISPKYTVEGGVLVINQKCIRDFILDFSKARRHNNTQRKIDGRELSVGDVLVNSTGVGTLGRIAQVLTLDEPSIVDSHVTVVRASTGLSWNYLGLALMRKQGEIESFGEGTTGQTELSRGKVASIKLIVPPSAVLQQFDETTLPLRQRFAANLKQAQTLATLRDTLLPRLISGQLRLPEADAMLELEEAVA